MKKKTIDKSVILNKLCRIINENEYYPNDEVNTFIEKHDLVDYQHISDLVASDGNGHFVVLNEQGECIVADRNEIGRLTA